MILLDNKKDKAVKLMYTKIFCESREGENSERKKDIWKGEERYKK